VDGWIRWHCGHEGNEFLCEVDRAYIEDGFNLYGLRAAVPHGNFQDCLDIILDKIEVEEFENINYMNMLAGQLYGLIHARFIVTSHGLSVMHSKYRQCDFGCCPRVLCGNQSVVPIGSSMDLNHDSVCIFCPKCGEVYSAGRNPLCSSRALDGAYFGPTFAHLFFMTYSHEVPQEPPQRYVPRVFGFRVNSLSESIAHLSRGREEATTPSSGAAGEAVASTEGGAETRRAAGRPIRTLARTTTRHQDSVAVVPDRQSTRNPAIQRAGMATSSTASGKEHGDQGTSKDGARGSQGGDGGSGKLESAKRGSIASTGGTGGGLSLRTKRQRTSDTPVSGSTKQ